MLVFSILPAGIRKCSPSKGHSPQRWFRWSLDGHSALYVWPAVVKSSLKVWPKGLLCGTDSGFYFWS